MILGYKYGRIFIENPGESKFPKWKDFLHYHFVSEKSNIMFNFPLWKEIPDAFYITRFGFLTPTQLNKILYIKYFRMIKYFTFFIVIRVPIKVFDKIKRL